MRTNKHKQVLEHLQNYGTIESMQAINLYGATRLSAIVFDLRKRGYDITTNMIEGTDRNGNDCRYARYILASKYNKGADNE